MKITDPKKIKLYYEAIHTRDSTFIGTFYFGVKTTGIFCIPSCRARTPNSENVVIFTDFKELLQNGFRPCKVCKPTENVFNVPQDVQAAITLIENSDKNRITDAVLRDNNIQPEKIRRWFKKNYHITYQTYQRMLRINSAYLNLKKSKNSVINTSFENGYESLSGFGYTFKKLTGFSPIQSSKKSIILINRIPTPLGPMFVCATDKGICLLEFTDRRMLETEFADLQKRLDSSIIVGENDHIQKLKIQLIQYFKGTRKEFDLMLVTPGTDFQNQVWANLAKIPYGETRTYQDQAKLIGNPKAVRAVARANGLNRIAIVIPCHRVIGKNNELVGYSGGIERKRKLLEHEQKNNV